MHIVIMGCGRVGSALAQTLEEQGHTVAVIDRDPTAFRRLGSSFGGRRVTGIGFDQDTLREAGIEDAGAFAAVSSGDNSNIIAARVAREMFGIENVAARIYDPRRAEVYQRLGIPTVATVRWTADQMLRRLLPRAPSRCGATRPAGSSSPRCTPPLVGGAPDQQAPGRDRGARGVPDPARRGDAAQLADGAAGGRPRACDDAHR
ncbi:hypothetical protein SHKM778_24110 [Streptomyces sp. KM77-8]|uniref:RCK N-terminal domain-containing protein n=1 Tax=Streptomyces haneummycinicus TaxID=3074435 RepID=A0AAT9HEX0_9ACTN